ncbi:MAG: hypothetical protein AB8F74_18795 [Saprospiraceae bacterium]
MALPKRKRKIIIDDQIYYWIAKGKFDVINLTVENAIGNRLFAKFNYDTLHKNSSYYAFPFVVTPYVVRETILYGINKDYLSTKKGKAIDLGNMSEIIRSYSLVERKVKKILKSIETRIDQGGLDLKKECIESVLAETRAFIKYGEILIGLENMIDNLSEIAFKFSEEEWILLKDISEMSRLNWESIRKRVIT